MKKLLLRCGLSPGDIVLLTAAVRDLHRCYPGQFVTDVRTSCMEIWDNNPFIEPLNESDSGVQQIDCSYPLINGSNEAPYHCIHGFIAFLNQTLDLDIRPTSFRGDIHLGDQEKAWYSQVHEVSGSDIPFWIIAAGGKYDLTIKWWQTARYQAVVNQLAGRVQFVQVGAPGDYHPKLDGVIDLRGQTSIRELIRLVHHSQGILCSVTALMHLAAAVETKHRLPSLRPCVVVAGGREPVHWAGYPGHQFIHTIGALPCCAHGGCWRDRVSPLKDGDERDRPYNLCADVSNGLPRCMEMITPEEVVRRIEAYHAGGMIEYLTSREQQGANRGVAATKVNAFDRQSLTLSRAGQACDEALAAISPVTTPGQGRGIVICGGGVRYFTNAWVCINMLRFHGCTLPIEVWHLGEREMNRRMARLLESLGARVVDAKSVQKTHPARILNGWELKPYSIIHSEFQEVLFLDADNVPVRNPEFLFESKEFGEKGAVFWPDYDHVTGHNPAAIWRSCGLRKPRELEFETGQIVVDKKRCWRALQLCLWFNENSDFYYQYLHGDKETFHLAFRKTGKSYALIKTPIHRLRFTMCQHDFRGRRLFQHRNMDKWDLFGNRKIRGFWFEKECETFVATLKGLWNGEIQRHLKPHRPVRTLVKSPRISAAIMAGLDGDEQVRVIKRLARTDWDTQPIDAGATNAVDPKKSICEALRLWVEASEDYLLLFWGNLIFNRHIRHNLTNWSPAIHRQIAMASLYNPQVQESACHLDKRARIVHPHHDLTPEALLLSRESVKMLLRDIKKEKGGVKECFSGLGRRINAPIFFHAPSLVQRQYKPEPGKYFHQAIDFDPDWRAQEI